VVERYYRVGETDFAVRTTSKEFCGWLDHALGKYRKRKKAPIYYSLVIARSEEQGQLGKGFHILYRGTSAIVRTLHLPTLARGLIQELESLTFPQREDAIYLDAALMYSNGATAITPSNLVSYIGKLGRRVDRSGVQLPGSTHVAVDPQSGWLVPIRSVLEIPGDAVERAGELTSSNGHRADRRFVEESLDPDMVLTFAGSELALQPVSRGQALHRLASYAMNLERLGGGALEGLRTFIERKRCYTLGNGDAKGLLETVSRALGGR
jgi:hypothetical protein